MLLLMHLWREGGSAPFDPAVLAKVTRTPLRQWAAIWKHVQALFQVEGGRITLSPRVEGDLVRPLSGDDSHG